jgi:hypothetical protein
MRYSPFSATASEKTIASDSNAEFFESVGKKVGAEALNGAILLIGARDSRAMALRHAQGALRFDRRASKWSHAALIVQWAASAGETSAVEVSLDPTDITLQVPERNGVTAFRLSRYFDSQRYPNVALAVLGFEPPPGTATLSKGAARSDALAPRERHAAVLAAALNPNRDRERFPLWDTLAPWARYAYAPHTTPNPLLEGIPLPSAALCEYAYEAAAVDLTPGATGNHNCPEVLYATMKHWAEGLKQTEGVSVRIFSVVRDECGTPQMELSPALDDLKPARPASKTRPTAKRPAKGKRR